jgi:hypothetical protein
MLFIQEADHSGDSKKRKVDPYAELSSSDGSLEVIFYTLVFSISKFDCTWAAMQISSFDCLFVV